MPKIVLDINDRRPAWALPPWVGEEIQRALPSGWSMQLMTTPAEGTGDGQAGTGGQVLEAVRDAEVYVGFGISEAVIHAGQRLRWVHSGSAGVGRSLTPELRRRDILFTNSAGVHGPPMAEAALGMLLYFWRGFDVAVAAARERRWSAQEFYEGSRDYPELSSSAVGILGLGGIGTELAGRLQALGARVLGLKRTPPPVGTVPQGVEVWVGLARLREFLAQCDALVVCLPATEETSGLLGAQQLQALRSSAVLINLSRGSVVDETALADALQAGRLRGAGLDVFAQEPLAADSPLWSLPNVLITPHVSPLSAHFWRRQTDLVLDNLGRYVTGRPLRNLVDQAAGY